MIDQTKLTDILNPNKFKSCKLKPWAVPNKSFLSIPFYGTPCSLTGLNLSIRSRLHGYVFTENATFVLHLHIVFLSFSYCSLWRSFSKVTVFSRFRVDAKGKTQRKVCGFNVNDMKTDSCRRFLSCGG